MEYRSRHHHHQQQQRRREEEEEVGMGYNNPPPLPPPPPPPPVPMRVTAFSKPFIPPPPAAAAAAAAPSPSLPLLSPRSALPVRNGTDFVNATPAATQLRSTASPDPLLPITSIPPSSPPPPAAAPVLIKYRECLRNHAAALGGHVLDGCGEYMAADEADSAMKCAACGCHRSFHRRETDRADMTSSVVPAGGSYYRRDRPMPPLPLLLPPPHPLTNPHNHHHQHHAVMLQSHSSYKQLVPPALIPTSPSGVAVGGDNNSGSGATTESSSEDGQDQQVVQQNMQVAVSKKRFRTKFTAEQKEKMLAFAERVGWRFHKQDEAVVEHLCREVGVRRQVLKVWMHNHKHSIKKQQQELLQLQQLQQQPLEM